MTDGQTIYVEDLTDEDIENSLTRANMASEVTLPATTLISMLLEIQDGRKKK